MMKKTSILIVNPSMTIGGVEKALISLLHAIPSDKYDVSLMLVNPCGDFMRFIPDHVHQVPFPLKQCFKGQHGLRNLLKNNLRHIRGVYLLAAWELYSLFKWEKPLANALFSSQNFHFDFVFNFGSFNTLPHLFINNCCLVKKKFIWLHNEFKLAGNNPRTYQHILKKYDEIFCVSDLIRKEIAQALPALEGKTKTLYNIVDIASISALAQQPGGFGDVFNGTRILSVGRLHPQKGFDIALEACKILVDKGYQIRWYILGEGEQRPALEQLIKQNKLENYFILLGAAANPYPYFKQCDIYVQSSRFEGYCLTLAEAKIFNKPIVTTNFAGTKEQIQDGITGLIVDTNSATIAAAVEKLLTTPKLQNTLSQNLKEQTDANNSFSPLESYLK